MSEEKLREELNALAAQLETLSGELARAEGSLARYLAIKIGMARRRHEQVQGALNRLKETQNATSSS